MEITSVLKARAILFIELDELNREGKIRLADCVQPLVEKYGFLGFPTKFEDFDLDDKGTIFQSGKAGDVLIDTLKIYNGAIVMDTLTTTQNSESLALELLRWGKDHFGLTFSPDLIRRVGYISHILFRTDFPLLAVSSSPAQRLAEKTSKVTERLFSGLKYVNHSVSIGHDPQVRKNTVASFIIQHRANTLYEENKYYSEAPLPTDLHIQYLQEFEADVLEFQK